MYKVAPITVYENDHQLWETYVGRDLPEMPLDYSVWGNTESDSRIKAFELSNLLNNK